MSIAHANLESKNVPKNPKPSKTPPQKQLTAVAYHRSSLSRAFSLFLSPSRRLFVIHSRVCRLNRSDPTRPPRDLLHFSQRIDLQRDRGVYGSPVLAQLHLSPARVVVVVVVVAPKLIMPCGGSWSGCALCVLYVRHNMCSNICKCFLKNLSIFFPWPVLYRSAWDWKKGFFLPWIT